ncbi:MAG TPA: fructose-bisphosphatase class II, partial [Candidatus Dormibacteraeota bacterium]
ARKVIDITDTVAANLKRIARAEGRDVEDLTVVVLNRPRHQRLLREIRDAGARVKLIPDGDISAGLWAAMEQRTGIDVLWGIGGAPEGVLAACAVKAVGGGMQGRLAPRDEGERAVMRAEGKDTGVLTLDDLCGGENVFFAATGVTEGHLLQGVRIAGRGQMSTHSVVMRSYSGTVRYIEATHDIARLQARATIAPAGGGL